MKTLPRMLWTLLVALVPLMAAAQGLPTKFDPQRDAAADLVAAQAQAKASGKRVLVDVGGEWCKWCHILDRFIASQPEIKAVLDSRYVWVKVNYSPDNKNTVVLAQWPKIRGYPHLFVLDADGKLLHSQETGVLESGDSYDAAKVLAFLQQASRAVAPPG
jgi:thioredoxin-related protein